MTPSIDEISLVPKPAILAPVSFYLTHLSDTIQAKDKSNSPERGIQIRRAWMNEYYNLDYLDWFCAGEQELHQSPPQQWGWAAK